MKFNDTPQITGKTLAVLPYYMNDDTLGSRVMEKDREYHTHLSPKMLQIQDAKHTGQILEDD